MTTRLINATLAYVLAIALLTVISSSATAEAKESSQPINLNDAVNPFIGTTNGGETYPGATMPFGMLQWSPRTGSSGSTADYEYQDSKVVGFPLTHLSGTGCGAGGDVPIMPLLAAPRISPELDRLFSTFSDNFFHANERAAPGYYSVTLDSGIKVELSAAYRSASGRFTFPRLMKRTILVRTSDSQNGSIASYTRVDPRSGTITGFVRSGGFCHRTLSPYYTLHFVIHFDRPITGFGTWHDGTLSPGTTSSGGSGDKYLLYPDSSVLLTSSGSGAWAQFPAKSQNTITMRVGLSYVSQENAENNLQTETPAGNTFDAVKERARSTWVRELGRILVLGGSTQQKSEFYTALYHTMVQPNVISDVNGEYFGFDNRVHHLSKNQRAQYSDFDSLWDLYRSYLQLIALINPDLANDFAISLLNQAEQSDGKWDRTTHISGLIHTMNGDDADPAIADLVAFGVKNFDAKGALESLARAASIETADDRDKSGCPTSCVGQRPSLGDWVRLHYIPLQASPRDGVVSDSLEYATDDFALSELARRLGDNQRYRLFLARSAYWQNLFNPNATPDGGYIQTRNADGSWPTFDPLADQQDQGYVEDSASIYQWMVPFDVNGLVSLMGGNDKANARLDAFFHDKDRNWSLIDGGLQADFENEPSLGTPWLYDFTGEPYKTQQTVRQIINSLWTDTPYGIPGNDDMGEMSSWYIWAALGMYPEIPGRAELVLGSPLFPEIRIHRPSGDIVIKATGASAATPYVQSLRVNGQEWNKPWLPESFVGNGGTLEYTLSSTPNAAWGSDPAAAPPSFAPQ